MKNLQINISVSPELYIKDPNSTELGQRILSQSIELINDLGFESFTFKKLGQSIGSTESSVYRYFESKHALLTYLICWYWSWLEYQLVFGTIAHKSAKQKLKAAITILTSPVSIDNSISHINEKLLNNIVVSESTKVFHTKGVDTENKKGNFRVYKQIVNRVSDMILAINPKYKYPHMLVSTVIEGSYQQVYFSEHLPSLMDGKKNCISTFYSQLIFKAIE